MAKTGPKPIEITPEILKDIEVYAMVGLTDRDIYLSMGHSSSWWYEAIKKFPELEDTTKRGRAKGKRLVMTKLWTRCEKGDIQAIRLYLQSQTFRLNLPTHAEEAAESALLPVQASVGTVDPVEASRIYQQIILGG